MKKIVYLTATVALSLGMVACGGNSKSEDEAENDQVAQSDDDYDSDDYSSYSQYSEDEMEDEESTPGTVKVETVKVQTVKVHGGDDDDDDATETSSSRASSVPVDISGLDDFISKGKSGDINKMIEALEWMNKKRNELKPYVRNLNESAIALAVKLDNANEKVGNKYDAFTLSGALGDKTESMNDSQLSRYNRACGNTCIFFSYNETDLSSKYNDIYRKMKYGL